MPIIHLKTLIEAPRERVFDLARNIDAHLISTADTGERAVAGVTRGMLGLDDEVTWEARHFGVRQRLKVKMTQMNRPSHFQDVMLEGAFKRMRHDHTFESRDGKTLMTDRFEFQAPWGILGMIAEHLFLIAYMRRFIAKRNQTLKRMAESSDWKKHFA